MKGARAALLLAACLGAAGPPGGALAGEPAAAGHVRLGLGDGTLRTVAFSAVASPDGAATGRIVFEDPTATPEVDGDGAATPGPGPAAPGVAVEAEVDCLVVDGHRAVVGGVVTTSPAPSYVGKYLLLFVEDAAPRDRLTWGFYPPADGTRCWRFPLAAYAPGHVDSGDLEVRP